MVSAITIEEGFQEFIGGKISFDSFALKLFHFQAFANQIYREYLSLINCEPTSINKVKDIPFLPINFFKHHAVITGDYQSEVIFSSSSTTGQTPSKHHVKSIDHYHANARRLFEQSLGPIEGKVIIGLLPSYLERSDSSLVSMVDHFIKRSGQELSGFHLYDLDSLVAVLESAKENDKSVVLFAVRYALLELAEKCQLDLTHVTIIETGGMKGKRGPVSNEDLRSIVNSKLKPSSLISEYGMTELQSQAYSDQEFIFTVPATMHILITDLNDPFTKLGEGRSGQLNVIDLANLFSCAFIATDDIGRKLSKDKFTVLGRIDNSEQRGCNLLVADIIT